MKISTLLFFLIFLVESVNSQVRLGPIAGIGFPKMQMEIAQRPWISNMRVGFQAGGAVEIPINRDFFIQTGLQFASKGQSYPVGETKMINNIYYIEAPLNLKFTKSVGMTDFGFYGGPYFAMGMDGTIKEVKNDGRIFTRKLIFGETTNEDFTSYDAGVNIGLVMEIANLSYSLQYGVGLLNISSDKNNLKQNRVISLSVAYLFKLK